ncbi:hypothetical protein [Thalassomonas sp. M1454]|uniref:hypothetical protein n=1 Tax=Thalassomonas sp. M1454 TaxID=2594477 RepID=UPI00117ED770|nr:hypothetical protein [Thalassomonas sp. M1454]TRX54490.1 hypothetical protein FNN08_12220 [Thalassomonas sp. M1454]
MRQIFKALILPFIITSLLAAGVFHTIRIDYFILENQLRETSLTEFLQQLFLLVSLSVFTYSAHKDEKSRPLYVLIAAFFGCMLIREMDYFLDMIFHGFWFYPAISVAVIAIIYSARHKSCLNKSALKFSQTNAYFNILVGLVIIMIFSRLLGSGGALWKEVMLDDYRHLYKTIIQEGLELFGYMFLLVGSFHQLRMIKKQFPQRNK